MADMFGALVCSSVDHPRRWSSSLPLSVVLHGVVLVAAVVVPLSAIGTLPTPASILAFSLPAPSAPPEAPVVPRVVRAPPSAAFVPLEAPPATAPDPEPSAPLATSPERGTRALAFDLGAGAWLPIGAAKGTPVLLPVPPPTPIHPGGLIRPPVKTVDVTPVYPSLARRARISGVVTIEAVIGEDGRVTDTRVLQSVPLLDQAVLDAVRQWRYSPTFLNGMAVPVILKVTVNFALK